MTAPDRTPHTDQPDWLDKPENVQRIIYALCAACALFALLDLIAPRKSAFYFDAWPGFYAGFGFICCVGLVLAAKLLRRLVMRREDYYD